MINEFSEERTKEIREAFEMFDKDKDNLLSSEETYYLLLSLGIEYDENEFWDFFLQNGIKTNETYLDPKNLKMDYLSLLGYLNKKSKEYDIEKELMTCFKLMDKDGDGKINATEMKYLLITLGEKFEDEEINEIIDVIDSTGQGAIMYEDFVKILLLK
jgi:calmodulin